MFWICKNATLDDGIGGWFSNCRTKKSISYLLLFRLNGKDGIKLAIRLELASVSSWYPGLAAALASAMSHGAGGGWPGRSKAGTLPGRSPGICSVGRRKARTITAGS